MIVWGEKTDSCRWDAFTRTLGGTYWWFGLAFKWVFIGVMIRTKDKP